MAGRRRTRSVLRRRCSEGGKGSRSPLCRRVPSLRLRAGSGRRPSHGAIGATMAITAAATAPAIATSHSGLSCGARRADGPGRVAARVRASPRRTAKRCSVFAAVPAPIDAASTRVTRVTPAIIAGIDASPEVSNDTCIRRITSTSAAASDVAATAAPSASSSRGPGRSRIDRSAPGPRSAATAMGGIRPSRQPSPVRRTGRSSPTGSLRGRSAPQPRSCGRSASADRGSR